MNKKQRGSSSLFLIRPEWILNFGNFALIQDLALELVLSGCMDAQQHDRIGGWMKYSERSRWEWIHDALMGSWWMRVRPIPRLDDGGSSLRFASRLGMTYRCGDGHIINLNSAVRSETNFWRSSSGKKAARAPASRCVQEADTQWLAVTVLTPPAP